MKDFTITDAPFTATILEIIAVSDAAKSLMGQHFGAGAVSATFSKSNAMAFVDYVQSKGLSIAVVATIIR